MRPLQIGYAHMCVSSPKSGRARCVRATQKMVATHALFMLNHQHIFVHVYVWKFISFEVVHAPFVESLYYLILDYCIPSYSFHGNYSFLNFEIEETLKFQFFT